MLLKLKSVWKTAAITLVILATVIWAGNPAAMLNHDTAEFQILQINDVYEIAPLSGGNEAGLARVATVRNDLLAENEQTFTIMAGDFFSPSALGTAKKADGDRLAGQQMVDTLNRMGLDLATFGNHEFDISESQFKDRLAESKFRWFSGNVFTAEGEQWENVPPYVIETVTSENGETIDVGFVGTTVRSNPAPYVSYLDPIEEMQHSVDAIKDKTDIIVAITHLNLPQDQLIAASIPEIDVVLGGHEHDNIQQWRGKDFTPIFKADANARSVYIHKLAYDLDSHKLKIKSRLKPLTEDTELDQMISRVVNYWEEQAFSGFRQNGFEPRATVANTNIPLDGLESSVRNGQTHLTEAIASALLNITDGVDVSIFNSGSIRIDDVLPPGTITQYDIIRILPFGGDIDTVDIGGALLKKVLDQGIANRGSGGYLQTAGVIKDNESQTWQIGDRPIVDTETYRVAIADFLLSGKEQGLDFLTRENPEVTLIDTHGDIRFALINQLKTMSN